MRSTELPWIRLVADQQLRFVDKRRRQLPPLLVAPAQLLHVIVAALTEAEPLEPGQR